VIDPQGKNPVSDHDGRLQIEEGSPAFRSRRHASVLALIGFSIVTCFAGLHEGPPLGDHECINALAARQSRLSGKWLIPELSGSPWIRKPPLGIWLIGGSSLLADPAGLREPVTQFSARLPSALAAFGTVILVAWLGRMTCGRRAGLIAGAVFSGSAFCIVFARNAQVEMVLTFFTVLAFACFWRGACGVRPDRRYLACFYVALSLAMMAKAPLPLAVVAVSLAVFWFVTLPLISAAEESASRSSLLDRTKVAFILSLRRVKSLWLIPGLPMFLALAGAWPLYVAMRVENALPLWRIEFLDRFAGEMADESRPIWYYVPLLFAMVFPYFLSLPEAMASPFLSRYRPWRKGLAFSFTWAIVGTVFLSLSSFKRPHYLAAVIPAYCLLLGVVIDRLFFGDCRSSFAMIRRTSFILIGVIFLAAISGGVVVRREYTDWLGGYVLLATAVSAAMTAACLLYARGRRTASFLSLNLGTVILVVFLWPIAGVAERSHEETEALARSLQQHGVKPGDPIFWVDGQLRSSLEFYFGYPCRRLINENEMAGLRTSRSQETMELYAAFGAHMTGVLQETIPTYLILSAGRFELMRQLGNIPARVLFRLDGFHEDDEDELVVLTQLENAGGQQ